MSPTVSQVIQWNPDAFHKAATGIDTIVTSLDGQFDGMDNEQNALAETWHGDAAAAAATRVLQEQSLGSAIAGAVAGVAEQYRGAAGIIEGARSHLVTVVSGARGSGFTVNEDGQIDPAGKLAWLAIAPEYTRDAARLQIEKEAAELTIVVVEALRQAAAAAVDASTRIRTAIAVVQQAGQAATSGNVVDAGDGKFDWMPNGPDTFAGTTVGGIMDSAGELLTKSAVASGDDIARNIGRGLGPFGAVLGTVPAIMNDIDGGMDVTQAVVSEGGGTLAGIGTAALAGMAMGSVFPGAGTATGLVVGAVVGGFTAWGGSKLIQRTWDFW